ncbi:MAG: hypothetical protein UV70_C0008G0008 [Parcubacteria group bacterium GW2011_GWA2_43_13]|nr:MAG: hypothetical protein UV70_C0008G0008 [Parcubacteria group bacterium GW2011_GWA2_43_13]HAZ16995.1 hypothetical protein [Candidatus Jacksonbacteria bacterium]
MASARLLNGLRKETRVILMKYYKIVVKTTTFYEYVNLVSFDIRYIIKHLNELSLYALVYPEGSSMRKSITVHSVFLSVATGIFLSSIILSPVSAELPAPHIITPSQTVYSNSITLTGTIEPPPIDGLMGYWSFDEISPTIQDTSDNDHSARMQNGNGRVVGKRGTAGWLTGTEFARLDAFDAIPATGFTWMAWVKTSNADPATRQNIITYMDTASCEDVMLGLNNTTRGPGFSFKVDSLGICPQGENHQVMWQPGGGVQSNQWYHVVGIMDYEHDRIALYVNGELKDSHAWIDDGISITRAMVGALGGHVFEPNSNWVGVIDEVKMFSRPLSATEIGSEYNDTQITVTGGSSTVTADVLGNSFSINVPLTMDTLNTLSVTATYGHADVSSASTIQITTASTAVIAPVISTVSQTINADSILVQGSVGDDPTDGLIGAWSFDDVAGTTAPDSSSNNNTASLINATVGTGKVGDAVHIGASDAYVDIPDTVHYTPTTGFAWSAWVRPESTAIGQSIITSYDAASCDDITLGIHIGEGYPLGFFFKNDYAGICPQHPNSRVFWQPEGGIELGQWYHVAAVMDYDNHEIALYVNGIKRVSQTWDGTPITRIMDTRIGDGGFWSSYFQGDIDEVKMYNRAVSSNEVLALSDPTITVTGGLATVNTQAVNGLYSVSVPLTQNQANTLSVTAINASNEQSAPATVVIRHDTITPETPVVTNGVLSAPTNTTPAIISGTKEANTSVWINGNQVVALNASTTWSYALALLEGSNSVSITLKDTVGNQSSALTGTIVLDITAPAVPNSTSFDQIVNADFIVISGTAEAGTVIHITGGAATATGTTHGSGNFSVSVNLTQNAINTLSMLATDVAGNVSSSRRVLIKEDSIAPATPTINALPSPTNITSHTLSGSRQGAMVIVSSTPAFSMLVLNGTMLISNNLVTSPVTIAPFETGKKIGSFIFVADNVEAVSVQDITILLSGSLLGSEEVRLYVDGVEIGSGIPIGGVLQIVGLDVTVPRNGRQNFTILADSQSDTEGVLWGGISAVEAVGFASGYAMPVTIGESTTDTWSFGVTLAEGETAIQILATDLAGNTSSVGTEVVLDTIKPVITLTGANPQTIELGTAYIELGATVADNYDTGLVVSINASLVNMTLVGEYAVDYSATDNSQNTQTVTRIVRVVDRTGPVVNAITHNHPDFVVRGADTVLITVTFTEYTNTIINPVIHIEDTATHAVLQTASLVATENPLIWTYLWDVPDVGDRQVSISVSATDSSGNSLGVLPDPNQAIAQVGLIFTIDNTAPTIVSRDPELGAVNQLPGMATITVNFDEPVSMTPANVTMSQDIVVESIDFFESSALIQIQGMTIVNTSYLVTMTGVTDIAGNPLPTTSWGFTTARAYNVAIQPGWNVISIPLTPTNPAIANVLGGLSNDIESVWSYDTLNNQWLVYRPGGDPLLNNLTTMTAGYGYWLKFNRATASSLTGYGNTFGSAQSVPPSVRLDYGWNLIGFYQVNDTDSTQANHALASLERDVNDAETSLWTQLWIYSPSELQYRSIGYTDTVHAGEGYWVFVRPLKPRITTEVWYAPGIE